MENNKKPPQVAGTTSEENYLLWIKNRERLEEAISIVNEKQIELQELTVLVQTFCVRKVRNDKSHHSQEREGFFFSLFIALLSLAIAIAALWLSIKEAF